MENLKIDISKTLDFISEEKVNGYKSEVTSHLKSLYEKNR